MRVRVFIILLLASVCSMVVHAQEVWDEDVLGPTFIPPMNGFVGASLLPNGVKYLPVPVDTTKLTFAGDFYRWQWGKMIRENARGTKTVRGNQAYYESQYGLNRMCIIMAQAIGLTITNAESNPRRTPKMIYFMYHTGDAGAAANQYAKQKYMRRRPFDQMHESTWGKYDTYADLMKPGNGSFPSSHTSFGWAVALSLAEMIPERQDTILRRGYMYGESREIVGAHWHTDVDAGRLTASAAVAYMHSMSTYRDSM
ncbi:MAG: phosphatase PAP2 family protein, partial [Muribaculaceae bacterium]|nr:phosphatase PAP2 family protein [Muribaculaceae bacterium]